MKHSDQYFELAEDKSQSSSYSREEIRVNCVLFCDIRLLMNHSKYEMNFQCWQEMRKNVKAKQSNINVWNRQTGNGPCPYGLTPDEEKVAIMIGIQTMNGIEGVKEVGLPKNNEDEFHYDENTLDYEGI